MSAPRFVTMRLGKDSVDDIRAIDARKGGIQEPPYVLAVTSNRFHVLLPRVALQSSG